MHRVVSHRQFDATVEQRQYGKEYARGHEPEGKERGLDYPPVRVGEKMRGSERELPLPRARTSLFLVSSDRPCNMIAPEEYFLSAGLNRNEDKHSQNGGAGTPRRLCA